MHSSKALTPHIDVSFVQNIFNERVDAQHTVESVSRFAKGNNSITFKIDCRGGARFVLKLLISRAQLENHLPHQYRWWYITPSPGYEWVKDVVSSHSLEAPAAIVANGQIEVGGLLHDYCIQEYLRGLDFQTRMFRRLIMGITGRLSFQHLLSRTLLAIHSVTSNQYGNNSIYSSFDLRSLFSELIEHEYEVLNALPQRHGDDFHYRILRFFKDGIKDLVEPESFSLVLGDFQGKVSLSGWQPVFRFYDIDHMHFGLPEQDLSILEHEGYNVGSSFYDHYTTRIKVDYHRLLLFTAFRHVCSYRRYVLQHDSKGARRSKSLIDDCIERGPSALKAFNNWY